MLLVETDMMMLLIHVVFLIQYMSIHLLGALFLLKFKVKHHIALFSLCCFNQ